MNLLELAESIGVTGFLECEELQKLVELAANRDVLEVGSFKGLSAWGMATVAKRLTCVDTFRANSAGQQQMDEYTTLGDFMEATRRYNYSHVTTWMMTSELAAESVCRDQAFDMIFVDASHTYEDCIADIRRWWPHVRAGGVLVGHDYAHNDWPGVKQAFDEIFGPAPEGTTLVTLRWIEKP